MRMALALNNPQRLIYHSIKKPNQFLIVMSRFKTLINVELTREFFLENFHLNQEGSHSILFDKDINPFTAVIYNSPLSPVPHSPAKDDWF